MFAVTQHFLVCFLLQRGEIDLTPFQKLGNFQRSSGTNLFNTNHSIRKKLVNEWLKKEAKVVGELTSIPFLLTGFRNSCSKASSAVQRLAGLNMSIFFNKLIAAGSAAGYNDSKLRPGFFSKLLIYSFACKYCSARNVKQYRT